MHRTDNFQKAERKGNAMTTDVDLGVVNMTQRLESDDFYMTVTCAVIVRIEIMFWYNVPFRVFDFLRHVLLCVSLGDHLQNEFKTETQESFVRGYNLLAPHPRNRTNNFNSF